jgi:hypothetical protein
MTPVPGPPADGSPADGAQAASGPAATAGIAVAGSAARRGRGPEPLPGAGSYDRPIPSPGVTPIGSIHEPGRTTVEGRVHVVEVRSVERNSVLAAEISDSTGDLTALFYGRAHIPGLICGSRVRFRGVVGLKGGNPVMTNPAYELLVPYTSQSADDGR